MTKKTDLIVNLILILISVLISFIPGAIFGYISMLLIIFTLTIAVAQDKSLLSVITDSGNKGNEEQSDFLSDRIISRAARIIKGISPVRFILASVVYLLIQYGAVILCNILVASVSGIGQFMIAVYALIEALKWLAIFFVISFKAKKPVSVMGYIAAFATPAVVSIVSTLLRDATLNNAPQINTIISYMDMMKYGGLSTNPLVSAILSGLFMFIIPTVIIITTHLTRKIKFKFINCATASQQPR